MKVGFLFPGQGAQCVGMGKELYKEYNEARKIYDKAEELSGMNVKKLCFEGPEDELMKTENAQIAILTTSLAYLSVLEKYGIKAKISVGLSLGEYTALIYGGYLKVEEGIRLIQKRGYYMENFLPQEEYTMVAVIGLDSKVIEEVCSHIRDEGKFVVPANYNCKVQTVVSGTVEAIEIAISKLKEVGAKRVIPLKTSGPFHTEKLSKAKELYQKELEKVDFQVGNGVKVIKNIDGEFYVETDNMKEILSEHIVSPVRFDKAIELMKEQGITDFVEIGPGKTLTGFVKKDYPEAQVHNVNSLENLQEFLKYANK